MSQSQEELYEVLIDLTGLLQHYVEGRSQNWDGSTKRQAQVTIARALKLYREFKSTKDRKMTDEKMRAMLSALAEAVLDFNGRTPIELAQEALDFLASDYPEDVCALCGRAQPCNDCKGAV